MLLSYAGFLAEPLRKALHAFAVAEVAKDPTSALGKMKGRAWSGRKLGEFEAPAEVRQFASLIQLLHPEALGLRWDAWPVILWEGGSIGWHDHRQAAFSAVAYLEVPPDAGQIEFASGPCLIRAGDVLVFDGLRPHRVTPGAGPRVSLSLNLYRS